MPARLQAPDNNRSVTLDKPILFVGRHPECDLIINHSRKVSRKHCCLAEINGHFVVRDLGSTNGVQINGRRVVGTKELNNGDELIIGDCLYTFYDGSVTPESLLSDAEKKRTSNGPTDPDEEPYPFEDDDITGKHISPDMSSDIPVLLDEPEEDGFDVYPRRNR